jgi:chemotaxis protein histidine kinase CheA
MTAPGGLVDFFVLEASEYIEQLDGLLAGAPASGPDAASVLQQARALRGSATMARQPFIAELATAVERVGRALHEGSLAWEPASRAALISAVDDLKLLVRAVRNWTPADEQRAQTRAAELTRYAPARVVNPATPASTTGSTFFAAETSNIAAGLELLAARSDDRASAENVLRRVRALRGVAGIKDVGPLADVMSAAELVVKPLELGEGAITPEGLEVLRRGADLLRWLSAALRAGTSADAPSPERDKFRAAMDAVRGGEPEGDRIVPISELFFADGGATIVSTAPNPPTTPAERFRLEMVSQGEHLQRLVADARDAHDPIAQDRVRRELQHALNSLRAGARSFGETEVAELIAGHDDAVESLDYLGLNALDSLASVIARPGAQGERLSNRLAELRSGGSRDAGIGAAFAGAEPAASPRAAADARLSTVFGATPPSLPTPSSAPTPIVNPAIPFTPAMQTPPSMPVTPAVAAARRSGETLLAALDAGISGFGALAEQPLVEPHAFEQPPVPIDALLYRGRAAIQRAIEIRDDVRRAGNAPREALDELFDLLDLALVE